MSGRVIDGRFVLRELLGRGGMSEVWLAEDRDLGRPVALKLLAGDADPARLVREARAIAALSHPNIAGLYDVGEAEGRPYLVLESLPGGTLEERLEDDMSVADHETRRLAAEIAAGLAHAHTSGIVHRDLKPSNVLFDTEGRAKLADFGIAQAAGQATLTEAGTVMGTAAYLSPEQAEGKPVGPAADVYSFGVLLYRLLTGRLPFTGATPLEVALKHQRERAAPVASIRPDAPADLAALAERSLAKNPADRPHDGAELMALLADRVTAVLPRSPAAEERTIVLGAPAPPDRRGTRRLGLLLALLALLGTAGVLAAVLVVGDGDTEQQLPSQTTPRTRTSELTTQSPQTTEPTTETSTTTTTATTTTQATTTQPTTQTEPTTATTPTTAPTATTATGP